MYVPSSFAEQRPPVLHDFIRAHPFATVIGQLDGMPYASHVPLHLQVDEAHPDGVLLGHFSRANAHANLVGLQALAIFHGPHAYISPTWYPGKHTHHREVPTWNYSVVHAYGVMELMDKAEDLLALLHALTDTHEHGRDPAWRVSDAPSDYIAQALRGIVGFRIPIARIEGKWKLGQNRPQEDRIAAGAGLLQRDSEGERQVGAAMQDTTTAS